MKKFNTTWSARVEKELAVVEKAVKMTAAQIVLNYPHIKVSGDGYNQLVGVRGLIEMIGTAKAISFIQRANACTGDVCRCKVYGGVQVSFYIN